MSATINANDLKFTIFGSGHDYTLADSGDGEKIFFSHPFIPKGARAYAGQYYFLAPIYDPSDETADPVFTDVVKDDIAHCTFDPALGTTFDTEGEVTVKVTYYREYIYPESTIVVEKELEQKVTVVDHGTVANTYSNLDIYTDGYAYIRPNSDTVEVKTYVLRGSDSITKCSSIPWRATALGDPRSGHNPYHFLNSANLTDISELAYADTSNCQWFYELFYNCQRLSDISALENWDTSKVQSMQFLFQFANVSSLEPLASWNTSSLTSLYNAFHEIYGVLTNLKGLEKWDVSKVTDLTEAFSIIGNPQRGYSLTDLTALKDWDVSKVASLSGTFSGSRNLQSLEGLENWDVSKVTNMLATFSHCEKVANLLPLSNWKPKPTTLQSAFNACYKIASTKGVDNFDTSNCTNMRETFFDCPKLLKVEGLENWDTSKVKTFYQMFMWDRWIESYLPLKDWSFESCTDIAGMFSQNANVTTLDGIIWDLSHLSSINGIFTGLDMCWAADIGKKVVKFYARYEDYEGNSYYTAEQYPVIGKDASEAENWTVNGTGLGAFDTTWSNRPSWN